MPRQAHNRPERPMYVCLFNSYVYPNQDAPSSLSIPPIVNSRPKTSDLRSMTPVHSFQETLQLINIPSLPTQAE